MSERRTLSIAAGVMGASIPGFMLIFTLWSQQGLAQADTFDPIKVAAFASNHPTLVGALYVLGVIMHVAALLLVIGLHRQLDGFSSLWVTAGSALGVLWAGADIIQNLMHYFIFLGDAPMETVAASTRTADALWHAGHFGGGAWVLVIAASGGAHFGRAYRALSLVAGLAFMLHPFVFPIAAWWFNLEFVLVPIWAFWTALAIWRGPRLGAAISP